MGVIPSIDEANLDRVIRELQALKVSGNDLFCRDAWLRGKQKLDVEVVNCPSSSKRVKGILAHLKSLRANFSKIVNSLDTVIQGVTDDHLDGIRSVDLHSIPDDILALIFEFYHEDYEHGIDADTDEDVEEAKQRDCSPVKLTSVCQRFRRVALHVPSLWEDASLDFSKGWLTNVVKERCQYPRVSVGISPHDEGEKLQDFLSSFHPNTKWKELNIKFSDHKRGSVTLNTIQGGIQGPFHSLEILSIHNYAWDCDQANSGTLLDERSREILQSWMLGPHLKTLSIQNIIPLPSNAPSLTFCHVYLSAFKSAPGENIDVFRWDIRELWCFLSSLVSLKTLSLDLWNAFGKDWAPVQSIGIDSLQLEVGGRTDPKFLDQLVKMIDYPKIVDMSIILHPLHEDPDEANEWIKSIFDVEYFEDEEDLTARSFDSLRKFSLKVEVRSHSLCAKYEPIFKAMPHIQDLSLSFPGFRGLEAEWNYYHDVGRFKDIRRLHLKDCDILKFFDVTCLFRDREKWPAFERLEVEGCKELRKSKLKLEKLARGNDKFVWKD